jgi:hypothetical protein
MLSLQGRSYEIRKSNPSVQIAANFFAVCRYNSASRRVFI